MSDVVALLVYGVLWSIWALAFVVTILCSIRLQLLRWRMFGEHKRSASRARLFLMGRARDEDLTVQGREENAAWRRTCFVGLAAGLVTGLMWVFLTSRPL